MSGPERGSTLPIGPIVEDGVVTAPSVKTLEGRAHRLRPVEPDRDARPLFDAAHGDARREEVWTYMLDGPFESVEAMHAWLERCRQSTRVVYFTVVRRDDDRPVGMTAFQRFVAPFRCIEIAHVWYDPDFQRTGANTEAIFLMLTEAFERLGCRRVEWKCDALNARSRTAAERLGFRFEGLFRQHMIIKGRSRDTAWFAMLDGEWPARKAAFERALASEGRVSLAALNRQSG